MSLLWRDTGKVVRFSFMDGRAAIGLVVFMFHWSLATFLFAVLLIVSFATLERFGYTLPNAFRKARSTLAGKYRRHKNKIEKIRYRSF